MADFVKIAGIVIKDNKLLLVKAKLKDIWKNTGGSLESGEEPADCLKREIQEEFRCAIKGIPEYALSTPETPAMEDPGKTVQINWYHCELEDDIDFNYEVEGDYRWFTKEDLESGNWSLSPQIKAYLLPYLFENNLIN